MRLLQTSMRTAFYNAKRRGVMVTVERYARVQGGKIVCVPCAVKI